jgi:predicted anti-sigma-YlaC factor YlaD
MDREYCQSLLASLSEYIDGTLEKELCLEIERHLEGCENCRIVVDSLHKTILLYQTTAAEVTVPEAVRQRLYSRLDLGEFLEK